MKKTVIQGYKKELEKIEKMMSAYLAMLDQPWPRETTWAIAQTQADRGDVRGFRFRERLFQQGDIDAIFEYIAVVGVSAFHAPWVFHSIRWWENLLSDKKPRFQWPPEELYNFTPQNPKRFIGEVQEDESVILPHPENHKRGRRKGEGLFSRPPKMYYRWRQIPWGEYARQEADAKKYLKQVHQAWGFVGGGAKKKLTPKETKEKKKESKRAYVKDKRASQYYDKAWEKYEAKKAALSRRGLLNKASLKKGVEEIENAEFSRRSEAKDAAHEWFIDKVKRDIATLLSKKILR